MNSLSRDLQLEKSSSRLMFRISLELMYVWNIVHSRWSCLLSRMQFLFKRVLKGTPWLMNKGCVLQSVSLGALSDVTVVLRLRQSLIQSPKILVILNLSSCTGSKVFVFLQIKPFDLPLIPADELTNTQRRTSNWL